MIKINLLPTKAAKKREDAILQIGIGLVACVLVAALCYLFNGTLESKVKKQQAEIVELKTKIDRLASIKREVEQFKKKRQDLESKIRTIEELNQKRTGPVKLLEEVGYVLPRKAWITAFKESEKQLTLEGIAADGPTVSDFVDALRQSNFFFNVNLVQIEQIGGGDDAFKKHRFSLNCTVNYLAGEKS